jgi:hypothetical protein
MARLVLLLLLALFLPTEVIARGGAESYRTFWILIVFVVVPAIFLLICLTFPRLTTTLLAVVVFLAWFILFLGISFPVALIAVAFGLVTLQEASFVAVACIPLAWGVWTLRERRARRRAAARYEEELRHDPVKSRLMKQAREIGKPPS